jgi:membrane-associated phospholipid phosphatase
MLTENCPSRLSKEDTACAREVLATARESERHSYKLPRTYTCEDKRYTCDNFLASFYKGLKHTAAGRLADPCGYATLAKALYVRDLALLESVPLGDGTDPLRLANPSASLCPSLVGAPNESYTTAMHPPPPFASARRAHEMTELYLMSALRDVQLAQLDIPAATEAAVVRAVGIMTSNAAEPIRITLTRGGQASAAAASFGSSGLFRGPFAGPREGGFLSSFLRNPTTLNSGQIVPATFTMRTPSANFMTDLTEYRARQITPPAPDMRGSTTPAPIATLRGLAEIVHTDFPNVFFAVAAMQILAAGVARNKFFQRYANQGAFVTNAGVGDLFAGFGEVTRTALQAAWFVKWRVFRTQRPEACGALYEQEIVLDTPLSSDGVSYLLPEAIRTFAPLRDAMALSHALDQSAMLPLPGAAPPANAGYLPQAYPEGAPTHPAFPSGHAVLSGALATYLKAMFETDVGFDGAVKLHDDIDKLAWNISVGRNVSGVHYSSDAVDGILLGEQVAIEYLRDSISACPDAGESAALSFRGFRGDRVEIYPRKIVKASGWLRCAMHVLLVLIMVTIIIVLARKLHKCRRTQY